MGLFCVTCNIGLTGVIAAEIACHMLVSNPEESYFHCTGAGVVQLVAAFHTSPWLLLVDRTSFTISSMSSFRTIKDFFNVGGEVTLTTDNLENEVEVMMIPSGGRQCSLFLTVVVEWNTQTPKKKTRPVDKVIVFPAEIRTGDSKIKVLLLEVMVGVNRTDVVDTLNSEEVKKWLFMCDDVMLRADSGPRRMMRSWSRVIEDLVAEALGPTSLNKERNPCMLNVARLCVDQLLGVTKEAVTTMFNTYDVTTVSILAKVDVDTRLMMTVCTVIAWRYALHANSKWINIFQVEDLMVSWPEILIKRK